jgi:transposase
VIGQSDVHQIVVGTILDSCVKVGSRKGRLNYDAAFKRELAAAACEAGVSVARLALDHGINANMLHKWRRQYLATKTTQANPSASQFLPVSVAHAGDSIINQSLPLPCPIKSSLSDQPAQSGVIEIKFGGAIVRIEGAVQASVLAAVLRHFRP